MNKTLQKLQAKRAQLSNKIAEIDAAIKAEQKKELEAARRESLAILQRSGVLDNPAALRQILETASASKSRGRAAEEEKSEA